jgi:hypothetical protein
MQRRGTAHPPGILQQRTYEGEGKRKKRAGVAIVLLFKEKQ